MGWKHAVSAGQADSGVFQVTTRVSKDGRVQSRVGCASHGKPSRTARVQVSKWVGKAGEAASAHASENMGTELRSVGVIQRVLEAPGKTQHLWSFDCPFLSPTHRTVVSSPPQKERGRGQVPACCRLRLTPLPGQPCWVGQRVLGTQNRG